MDFFIMTKLKEKSQGQLIKTEDPSFFFSSKLNFKTAVNARVIYRKCFGIFPHSTTKSRFHSTYNRVATQNAAIEQLPKTARVLFCNRGSKRRGSLAE